MAQDVTRSWFAVLNNPQDHGYEGTPQAICEQLRDEWIGDSTTRSGAWAYCVSADNLPHVHMVLEDAVAMRFSVVKKSYAIGCHLEPTRGSKRQAEDYINKRHPYDEKGEEVVCIVRTGTIMGAPGKRNDLETIGALLEDGLNPQQIMDNNFSFRRHEKEIRSAYFRKLWKETPPIREVRVHLFVGSSGSGKTHKYVELCEEVGEDDICLVTDYSINGGMDHYSGESILFLDEFKGQYSYSTYLIDLKGGMDYYGWECVCHTAYTMAKARDILKELVKELETRKEVLRRAGCSNLQIYNERVRPLYKRIVIGCDEIAELLDKTGRIKADKEIIDEITGYLATIARQGRAMGIHIIAATQRPDSNTLPGQIKCNIDCRICGRADNVLSQIILDNTDAADAIPKDAQGRFIMSDGTVFQGFWSDDLDEWFLL